MDQKRRQLLNAAGGLGVLGLLVAAGVISPAQAQAAAARPGFDARELDAALAAVFSIPEGTQPEVITRLKMAQSADVVALVRAGGRFHVARKAVIVTISGCG